MKVSTFFVVWLCVAVGGVRAQRSNTNACIPQMGALLQPGVTCPQIISVYQQGCWCNPAVQVVLGQAYLLLSIMEATQLVACKAALGVPDVDCQNFVHEEPGCGGISSMDLDAARLTNVFGFNRAFQEFTAAECFDFEATVERFKPFFEPVNPSYFVPYGSGLFVGIDKMIEYFVTVFLPSNRGLILQGPPVQGVGGGAFSDDGLRFTAVSSLRGSFADGKIPYGPTPLFYNNFNFQACSPLVQSFDIPPATTMGFLASNVHRLANEFDKWGVDAVCEYHEAYCVPAGYAQYSSKEECVHYISSLPPYTAACGPNRPLAGNSLTCKFKHHFMTPFAPENHCAHIGPEGTPDNEGVLKCVDSIECPDPPIAYQALLDATASALGEAPGSNYLNLTLPAEQIPVVAQSNAEYAAEGFKGPIICEKEKMTPAPTPRKKGKKGRKSGGKRSKTVAPVMAPKPPRPSYEDFAVKAIMGLVEQVCPKAGEGPAGATVCQEIKQFVAIGETRYKGVLPDHYYASYLVFVLTPLLGTPLGSTPGLGQFVLVEAFRYHIVLGLANGRRLLGSSEEFIEDLYWELDASIKASAMQAPLTAGDGVDSYCDIIQGEYNRFKQFAADNYAPAEIPSFSPVYDFDLLKVFCADPFTGSSYRTDWEHHRTEVLSSLMYKACSKPIVLYTIWHLESSFLLLVPSPDRQPQYDMVIKAFDFIAETFDSPDASCVALMGM